MREALDLYIATAPVGAVVTYAVLGMLSIGLGPFAVANLIQHVRAARLAAPGLR